MYIACMYCFVEVGEELLHHVFHFGYVLLYGFDKGDLNAHRYSY